MTRYKCESCANGQHESHESTVRDEDGSQRLCRCWCCSGYDQDGEIERESRERYHRGF